MALDGRASQRLRCTRSPLYRRKDSRRLKAVICASAIRKFQMQGTALSPRQTQIWTAHGEMLLKNPAKTQALRRKGGVVLEPHKNSFPKNSLVFVPVSFAMLPCCFADMKAEAVQTLQLRA